MKANRPSFFLEVRPEPGVNVTAALKAVLERLFRSHGFKCLEIREVSE